MRRLVLFFVACLALPSIAHAQKSEPRTTSPPSPTTRAPETVSPGRGTPVSGHVYLGEAAPDFELEATNGDRVKLSSWKGDFVVILFADRRARLRDLDGLALRLQPAGARVVAVVHENLQALRSFTRREATAYWALADPLGEIAAVYGLWDPIRSATRPGTVLVDRDGSVRFMLGGQDFPAEDLERLVQFALQGL